MSRNSLVIARTTRVGRPAVLAAGLAIGLCSFGRLAHADGAEIASGDVASGEVASPAVAERDAGPSLTASISAAGSMDVDVGTVGASAIARAGASWAVGSRTTLGPFGEASATAWDGGARAIVGGAGFAVRVRLPGERVALEPAVTFGLQRAAGDWTPTYGSSVAVLLGSLRAGVASRLYFDGDRGTELHAFLGWQLA
ncbi:MAG: hypothetical protein ACTHU0_01210 [Kofleriaceae bacterium]